MGVSSQTGRDLEIFTYLFSVLCSSTGDPTLLGRSVSSNSVGPWHIQEDDDEQGALPVRIGPVFPSYLLISNLSVLTPATGVKETVGDDS